MSLPRLGSVIGALTLAGIARGGVVHRDVDRFVRVDFSTPPAPALLQQNASDGFWDATVSDAVFDDLSGAFASGTAFQRSNLTALGVSMVGSVSANASTDGFVSASTELHSLISVDEATSYRASAELFDLFLGNPDLSFAASLVAEGGRGEVIWSASSSDVFLPGTGSFSFGVQTGELAPGDYRFSMRIAAGGFKDAITESGFNVQLVIPAPAGGGVFAGVGLMAGRRRARGRTRVGST
ncbi:MAG: hypothetical protein ACIARR_12250 [Phycisphaerales bacterium JB059]